MKKSWTSFLMTGFLALSFAEAKVHGILKDGSVDVSALPNPPISGSQIDIDDLAVVERYQITRTEADCQEAQVLADMDLAQVFGAPRGPLTADEVQSVAHLYQVLSKDASQVVKVLKSKFNRPRPFSRKESIKQCVTASPSNSYPSGHATVSRTAARVFCDLFPSKCDALIAVADTVSESRVLGAAHHPKDVELGKQVGDLIFAAYLTNVDYIKCRENRDYCNQLGKRDGEVEKPGKEEDKPKRPEY